MNKSKRFVKLLKKIKKISKKDRKERDSERRDTATMEKKEENKFFKKSKELLRFLG